MGTHNDNIIRKVAEKKFLSQRLRNTIACIAIALTTFMLYTVFSLGLNYQQGMEILQIQQHGTSADMLLPSPSDEQFANLQNSGLCSYIGICTAVATLTDIEDTGISVAYLRYADEVCWKEQIYQALINIEGRYPEAENEIMMPRWAATKLGLSNPKVGQEIELPFYYGYIFMRFSRISDDKKKKFVISGLYDDPSSTMIQNEVPMYISKSFWDGAPGKRNQYRDAAYITLKNKSDASVLSEMMVMTDENQELADLTSHAAENTEGILQIAAVVFIILLCGGLIVYNILYISVAQEIQFLGKLKTLGMTRRQIKKYMGFQVRWMCLAGIPSGMALAALVSVFIVPSALKAVNSTLAEADAGVSFSPVLFAGVALISAVAVFLGSRKPLRMAGSVSPVLAAKFVSVSSRKERKKNQDSMRSFAWRNIFRNKKSAVVVFLTLFLAISIFLTVHGLLSGVNSSVMVADANPYDLVIRDEHFEGLLTEDTLKRIADMSGVTRIEIRSCLNADSPESLIEVNGGAVKKYCDTFYEEFSSSMTKEQFDEVKGMYIKGNNYITNIIGIGEWEFERIVEEYGLDISNHAFLAGKIGLWGYSNAEVDTDPIATFYPLGSEGKKYTIKMADHPINNSEFDMTSLIAPNIIVSNDLLKEITESCIWEINIQTENDSKDMLVYDALKEMFQDVEGVSIDSKQEKVLRLDESFSTLKMIAASLSFILFAIGIMNFINTIYAGILAREKELAMLECIGMSKKQVKRMLIGEGLLYAVVTGILVITVGNAIYFGAFKVFSNMTGWSQFHYPLCAAVVMAVAMFAVAVTVPLISYRSISGDYAIEQLRKSD